MITQAIIPLRMIFWGGLICVLDLSVTQTSNGTGFKFDIINDAVGAVMICVGIFRLGVLPVSSKYDTAMSFTRAVAVLSVVDAIREHVVVPLSSPVQFMLYVLGITNLAATIVFCVAMRWLCSATRLNLSEASWRTTTTLLVYIYVVPQGFFLLIEMASIASRDFRLNLGLAKLILLPLSVIPIAHLFVSISRMRNEAELSVWDPE